MNKKGILPLLAAPVVLTTGMLIVIAIIIFMFILGIGGLIAWITSHWVILLGAFLIVMSIIYVIKISQQKQTKFNTAVFFMLLGVGLILVLANGVIQTSFIEKGVDYYNTAEYGLVKVVASQSSSLVKESYFSKTQGVVGDKITISTIIWPFSDCSKVKLKSFKIYILKDGTTTSTLDMLSKISCGTQTLSTSFTPSSPGKYTIYDELKWSSLTGDTTTVHTDYIRNADNYVLTINEATKACTKPEVTYTSWAFLRSVDNGVIQTRDVQELESDCTYRLRNNEERIVCNDGYKVASTTSSSISDYSGAAGQNCVLKEVPVIPPVVNPPVEPEVPDCECEVDITSTCPDKSIIISKKCENCILKDTGSICSELPTSANGSTIPEETTNDYTQIVVIIASIIVGLILLLIIYKYVRRK